MKQLKTYFLILVVLSISSWGQGGTLKIYGDVPLEWPSLSHYYARDSATCATLAVIKTYLTDQSLTFHLTWDDQEIDSRKITQDIRRWKDPEGKIRDKDLMYYYDGLGIRIFYKELFYEGWIRPLSQGEWEVQWENAGSMKTRKSDPVAIMKLERKSGYLNVDILFPEIDWRLAEGEMLKITLIAADADTPRTGEVKARLANSPCYCTSTKELIISK